MHGFKSWLVQWDASELLNCLELPYHPSVGARRHQDYVMYCNVLIVDSLATVENFIIIFSNIMQLDDIALWGIKDGVYFVILI